MAAKQNSLKSGVLGELNGSKTNGGPTLFTKYLVVTPAANQTTRICQNFGHAHDLVVPKNWQGELGLKPNIPEIPSLNENSAYAFPPS